MKMIILVGLLIFMLIVPIRPSVIAGELHDAVEAGDIARVRLLLKEGEDVNASTAGQERWMPLHAALCFGQYEIAKLLIEKGANVNTIDSINQFAPLHWAASMGSTEVARLLVEKGADVNAKGGGQVTPLHKAASKGSAGVAKLLIEEGADVNARTDEQSTPLHEAAMYGHTAVAKILIEEGADINARDEYQQTPLWFAEYRSHTEVANLLIEKGAVQKTLLHWAAVDGKTERAAVLMQNGADVNARDSDQKTPLHDAAQYGHADVAKLLIEGGANVNAMSVDAEDQWKQWTPLHWAVFNGNSEVAGLLIEKGADVTVKNSPISQWDASLEAFYGYKAGAGFLENKDYENAYSAFLKAAQLIPTEPYYVWALAVCSFESGHRNREAIWAYEKTLSLGKPLSRGDYNMLGLAYAITGDYASAKAVYDEGVGKYPGDTALMQWRVVVAYGAGGWDEATKVWGENRPGYDTSRERTERLNLLYNGLRDITARAERQGGHYTTFGHLSLIYRLLSEGTRHNIYNDDDKRWVKETLKQVRADMVEIYLILPLKPVVPERARRLAIEGQAFVDAGDIQKAVDRYGLAVELSPCWPEGIYNLAVTARAGGPWLPGAIEEMKTYLRVVPEWRNTAKEQAMLASWENDLQRALEVGGVIVEIPVGSSGNELAQLYGADNGGAIPGHGPMIPWRPR